MSIEQALEVAASRGLLINNLFQLADGTWQCNTRLAGNDPITQRFARGATALEALEKAIALLAPTEPLMLPPPPLALPPPSAVSEKPFDIEGLF